VAEQFIMILSIKANTVSKVMSVVGVHVLCVSIIQFEVSHKRLSAFNDL